MPIVIQPYREEHEPAVKALNQRLLRGLPDQDLAFYESCCPSWLAKIEGSSLYNQYFVALEDGEVRGAYALKYEKFYLAGQGEHAVACYHHPLSEGVIDRKYSTVGGLLLRDALRREPMLYALGMGSLDRPLPAMLKATGWSLQIVPFYFLVVHPYRFLRQMAVLRQSGWRRWLMDAGAFTGTGWAVLAAARGFRRLGRAQFSAYDVEEFDSFLDWADDSWREAREAYLLASVRDRETLARLYPPSGPHLTKLCVRKEGGAVGWAVVGERRRDAKFGTLRVGSIVDCWALPENAETVTRAATRVLEQKGMDLIVSNQSHRQWGRAMEVCGFFRAESNFIFAASKKFDALLRQNNMDQHNLANFHLTRANGDGLPRNF